METCGASWSFVETCGYLGRPVDTCWDLWLLETCGDLRRLEETFGNSQRLAETLNNLLSEELATLSFFSTQKRDKRKMNPIKETTTIFFWTIFLCHHRYFFSKNLVFQLACDSSISRDVIGISGYDKESLRKQASPERRAQIRNFIILTDKKIRVGGEKN